MHTLSALLKNRWLPVFLVAIAALGLAFSPPSLSSWENPEEEATVSLEDLRLFSEAYALIKHRYVDRVDDGTLMRNAIQGMLNGLDPYTTHLEETEFEEWVTSTTGKFGGLGIVITKKDMKAPIHIISPIDDTPAQRAGIRAGDQILEIDSKPVFDMSMQDAVKAMRGKPGSTVELTVRREGVDKPFPVSLQRDIIRVTSVRSRMLEPRYAYLRISNFQATTTQSFRKHLIKALSNADGRPKGLILDLRNNPGGLLDSAVDISDMFLNDEQLIVSTRGRTEESNLVENASGKDLAHDIPVVILINKGSASASEIVAGALQDNERAQVLGKRSFGKGSVQNVLPFQGKKSAIKLTVARYYTPSGRSIHKEGIQPDYEVEYVSPGPDSSLSPDYSNILDVDNQVRAALHLLKTGNLPAEASAGGAS